MSAEGPTSPPCNCSGAMYPGVPMMERASILIPCPSRCRPRDAEVGHDRLLVASLAHEHDVAALEVAMDDAGLMSGPEPVRHLDCERERVIEGQPACLRHRSRSVCPRSSSMVKNHTAALPSPCLSEVIHTADIRDAIWSARGALRA